MSGKKDHKKFQGIYLDTPFLLPCLHLAKRYGQHRLVVMHRNRVGKNYTPSWDVATVVVQFT